MFIVCPKCFFKRTVDSKQIPAAATMATCPRCEEKFRFRNPETGAYIGKICLEFEDELSPQKHDTQNVQEQNKENSSTIVTNNATELSTSQSTATPTTPLENPTTAQIESPLTSVEDKEHEFNPNHEPIADEILNEEVEEVEETSKNTNKNIANEQNPSKLESPSHIQDNNKQNTYIQDTSDENPLLEEEVARVKQEEQENPLFDNYFGKQEEGKQKNQKYQMVSDDVPWEHPERYGIFGSLFQTIARVMFRAPEFFNTIHSQASALRPALFYALLGLFQALCLQMWLSTLEAQIIEIAPQMQESVAAMSTPLAIMLSPFQAIFQLVLYSAFLYLAIRITNPDKADFNLILRVTAYSYAPSILAIVPYIGPMVGLIWFVVNIVIGIRYALRLTWQKTFLALSPIFVLLIFIMSNVISMFNIY